MAAPDVPDTPWHAAYPAPRSEVEALPRQELLRWIQEGKLAGRDYVLVDVRRTDFEGGTIRGSMNLPAQSLYPTRPALYTLFASSGVEHVIWYCGSCRGRGPRSAAWFQDYLVEQGNSHMKSMILEGGIKGWVAAGREYVELMDEYDASVWTK